jgi:hypothetical protein
MASIFKTLFGRRGGEADKAEPGPAAGGPATEYKGFRIVPAPYQADGQYQTAGTIEKDFPDGTKTHRFVRADKHGSKDDAIAFSLSKGQQIIDEQGDGLFRNA